MIYYININHKNIVLSGLSPVIKNHVHVHNWGGTTFRTKLR